jgi:hypothetical protein
MKQKLSITLVVIAITSAVLLLPPQCFSNSYTASYHLLENPLSSKQYKLNVVVSQSLYEYYVGKSHKQTSPEDFAKFVTPYALKPIADKLWMIYNNHEDFANGVLMIVHQIPYSVTASAKYPVETIVENCGDCDLFSYIAASIMKAGGLEVILLYYEDQAHMNVGVHLPSPPRYVRTPAYYVVHNGVRYYIAECTGDDWTKGWRVGECPEDLMHATPQIIELENCEEWAPGQVSASYKPLSSSAIFLTASSTFVLQGSTVTLMGQLSPKLQSKSITIYIRVGSTWNILAFTETDSDGKFTCMWNAQETGICQFRASWSGDEDYAGADSPIVTVTVMSTFFLTLLAVTAVLVCVSILFFLMAAQRHYKVEEPKLPEIPS